MILLAITTIKRKEQLEKDIELLKRLRDKALQNSKTLPFLFSRNLAWKAYNEFVEEIKEKRKTLRSL